MWNIEKAEKGTHHEYWYWLSRSTRGFDILRHDALFEGKGKYHAMPLEGIVLRRKGVLKATW